MHALLIGATGATGLDLLQLLLDDNRFTQVSVFVRRDISLKNSKLTSYIVDFDQPESWKDLVVGDVLFSCLGTTLKAAGSKSAQWKIDYDYQFQTAKIARENGVNTYVLVSSAQASASSAFFYVKMKGQLENAVKDLHFPRTIIFNPPLLIRKNSDRKAEVISAKIIRFLNKIGLFRSQKPLSTEALAQAMVAAVHRLPNGTHSVREFDN